MRMLLMLLLLVSIGCGATAPKPVITVANTDMPLTITLTPRVVLVYTDFWFHCKLPTQVPDGIVIYGASGHFHSEGPIDRRVYSRIVTAPCENLRLYCGHRQAGKSEPEMINHILEPVGECR